MKEIFQTYLNRLIDLTSRNKSIYLSKLIPTQMIDFNDFSFLNHLPSFGYIQQLLERKSHIPLIAKLDARNTAINFLSQRLKRLQHQIQLTENETGEKSLYVAWPFVEGKLLNGQLVRCPLLFFPVDLKEENGTWTIQSEGSFTPVFNQSFLLAYAHANNLSLSGNWTSLALEDFPKDPIAFRTALYQFLTSEITINFSQELFEDKLVNFPESSKSVDDEVLGLGKLKLMSYAVLGQFSQKTSFLIEDYESLMANSSTSDLDTFFSNKFFKVESDFIPREDHFYTVFPMDSSQEKVIRAVRSGESCVVQGPPGTGKSQLIANMTVDFISRGKKVLIVSQKKAALDVVYRRLEMKGFSDFLGMVHDIKSDRRALFDKINQQIEAIDDFKHYNRSLDAIQLERRFIQLSRTIEQHSDYFEEYKRALYSQEECGKPIKELYVEGPVEDDYFEMNPFIQSFSWDRVNAFQVKLELFFKYYKKYQQSNSFWLHRHNFSAFDALGFERLKQTLDEIDQVVEDAQIQFDLVENQTLSFFSFYPQKVKLLELLYLLENNEVKVVFEKSDAVDSNEMDMLWLENKFYIIKKLLEEDIEWSSLDREVEHFHFLATQFKEKHESWLKFPSVLWDRSYWSPIYQLLQKNGLKNDQNGRNNLIRILENRLNLNHQYTLLSSKRWVVLPHKPLNYAVFNHAATINLKGIQARIAFNEISKQFGKINVFSNQPDQLCQWLKEAIQFFENLEQNWLRWEIYLSKIQIQHLLNGIITGGNQTIKAELRDTFDELVDFDGLTSKMDPVHQEVMEKLIQAYPDLEIESIQINFLKGLRLAWIDHLEAKYPILKEITSPKTAIIHEEFIQSVKEKWQVANRIVSLRLRENVLKDLEYNRLNNLITYRDLKHQVSKQKKIWSIKQVTSKYEEEIFKLLPCWLASPETVSSIFDMQQTFDLVIFDEASQCFVEKGLPAMLRGKQVVIVGDSQQLRPTDLYQVRLAGEEEDIALESDSLLDLTSKYFCTYTLENHYRSAQLPLIHFSNQRFYHNKLVMLPTFDLANEQIMPYELVIVNGIWENQTNELEALRVVEKIKDIQNKTPQSTIGVITFNYFQMQLIQDLVDENNSIDPSLLSIKNIENVQGDEFDHVIFSIGYARNRQGKMISNFGLLAKAGGKNRLNVAITRAKSKITLICSILPADFSQKQLENEGINLLKQYIEFVQKLTVGEGMFVPERVSSEYLTHWLLYRKLISKFEDQYQRFEQSAWMDLVRIKDNSYVSALLTDDFRFYEAQNAKEFMVYQALQLRQKGWPFKYYYSRNYWKGQYPY
jgi:hypothetical protein